MVKITNIVYAIAFTTVGAINVNAVPGSIGKLQPIVNPNEN